MPSHLPCLWIIYWGLHVVVSAVTGIIYSTCTSTHSVVQCLKNGTFLIVVVFDHCITYVELVFPVYSNVDDDLTLNNSVCRSLHPNVVSHVFLWTFALLVSLKKVFKSFSTRMMSLLT